MDWNVDVEAPTPIHRTAAKTAVAEFDRRRHDQRVVDDGLPVSRRKRLKNFGIEKEVTPELAYVRAPTRPATRLNDINGEFFEVQIS